MICILGVKGMCTDVCTFIWNEKKVDESKIVGTTYKWIYMGQRNILKNRSI